MKHSALFYSSICSLFCVCVVYSNEIYKIYNLESDKVCDYVIPRVTKRITTGSDGVIVKENTYFDRLTGNHAFKCHFEVETGFKSSLPGLFAVIQKLHLRKDPTTGDCIDYIRIRPADKDLISEISHFNFNLKKNKMPWKTFCGDLSARRDGGRENPSSEPTTLLSVTGYLSEKEPIIEVEVYINKIPIVNESLELEVAFTPYTYCKNTWSEYRECAMEKCIKKQFFNDGRVNCPFPDCIDEEGCDISIIHQGEHQGGKKKKK